jgi:hypothetical protein
MKGAMKFEGIRLFLLLRKNCPIPIEKETG